MDGMRTGDRGHLVVTPQRSELKPGAVVSVYKISAYLCDGDTERFSCCNQHQISTWT